ncbi:PSME3-interacting protein-like [Neopsephotus bourkii]|uniref:PSME3-interacting protein-like n=1 Tax=Neopsephotus bourkii TaxID=309878 RepID=UPI002AA5ADC9|nr:PSME3-interacting protein-like [Neopsephotus bourkii]
MKTGSSTMDGTDGTADLVIHKRFVSESELEERQKRRQEQWEKVRKPEDPEECPEEAYSSHSLSEILQEQREKMQKEFEEQFKFIHSTLSEVGVSVDTKKETEKKLPIKSVENKNTFSQSKLLAGAVKHSSDGGNSVKRLKLDTDHDEKNQEKTSCVPLGSSSVGGSTVHCSSAAVCIGILPSLGTYSGSSDSESSSDSEGTINSTGKIISSVFHSNNFFDGP